MRDSLLIQRADEVNADLESRGIEFSYNDNPVIINLNALKKLKANAKKMLGIGNKITKVELLKLLADRIADKESGLVGLKIQTPEGIAEYQEHKTGELTPLIAKSLKKDGTIVSKEVFDTSQRPNLDIHVIIDVATAEKARLDNSELFEANERLIAFKKEMDDQIKSKKELWSAHDKMQALIDEITSASPLLSSRLGFDRLKDRDPYITNLYSLGSVTQVFKELMDKVIVKDLKLDIGKLDYPDFKSILVIFENVNSTLENLSVLAKDYDEMDSDEQRQELERLSDEFKAVDAGRSETAQTVYRMTKTADESMVESLVRQNRGIAVEVERGINNYGLLEVSIQRNDRAIQEILADTSEDVKLQVESEWKTIEHKRDAEGLTAIDKKDRFEKTQQKALEARQDLRDASDITVDEEIRLLPLVLSRGNLSLENDPVQQQLSILQKGFNKKFDTLLKENKDELNKFQYPHLIGIRNLIIQQQQILESKYADSEKPSIWKDRLEYSKRIKAFEEQKIRLNEEIRTLSEMVPIAENIVPKQQTIKIVDAYLAKLSAANMLGERSAYGYKGGYRVEIASDTNAVKLFGKLEIYIDEELEQKLDAGIADKAEQYVERGERLEELKRRQRGY